MFFLLFAILGYIFIILHLYFKNNLKDISFFVKLPVILGLFLFTFPLANLIFLLVKKYKFSQIGFSFKPLNKLILAIFIWSLTGLVAYFFNYDGIIWKEGLKVLGGFWGLILNGLIAAALVEEFSRFLLFTRFNKVFNNVGIAIL